MASLAKQFKTIINAEGLWAAMRWVNDRVPYRYTAIFAFDGNTLRNICLIDKKDPEVIHCGDQPITESYCIYIHRSGEGFSVEEALQDSRVEGHPKRGNYQCYYGIPLIGLDGKLLGTVCHFDISPVRVTENIVMILDDLAPLIAEAAFNEGRAPAHRY